MDAALHNLLLEDSEVAGLLALMLLTDARRPARTGPDGELIPLAQQDRTLWDRHAISEGITLISSTLSPGSIDHPGASTVRFRSRDKLSCSGMRRSTLLELSSMELHEVAHVRRCFAGELAHGVRHAVVTPLPGQLGHG